MKTYKEFMSENRYSGLIKGSMVYFASKLNALEKQIKQEKNAMRKLDLIAQQNKLIGYFNLYPII